ncbi:hypothetical protein BGW80DRAFT_1290777 [Lactifluus volemus]|nr:hypothetical protein BGW80DRAFT_1290777 [Lactifluus volemus]
MQRFTLIFLMVLIALVGVQAALPEDNMFVKRDTNKIIRDEPVPFKSRKPEQPKTKGPEVPQPRETPAS